MKTIWILVTVIISAGERREVTDHFSSEAKAKKAMAAFKLTQSIGWIDEDVVDQYIYDKPVY